MRSQIFSGFNGLMVICCLFWFSSCQPSKKTHIDRLYIQGIDTSLYTEVKLPEQVIQNGDMLSITVYSDNPEATVAYNQAQITNSRQTTGTGEGAGNSGGYLVDREGNIVFHSLGPIRVQNMTRAQLKQMLQDKLQTYLTHPYVDVRFMNKRITVLGEVTKPGMINMPEEKISILDALALSGDMTNFGRRDNVLVIREENGKRTSQRLNLKDPAVYKSDYFYLHSEDFVYVEPNRKKPSGTDAVLLRNLSITATLVSTLAIIYSIFK